MSPGPIEPHIALGPLLSALWVFSVGTVVTLLFAGAVWRLMTHRGRALRAESIAKESPRLASGPALLVGKVETDDGGPAVRIEIDQVGSETKNKNGYSHEWEERHRAVRMRPFRLRLPTDDVVTVIPDERIHLVDNLTTDKHDGTYRRRVAELTAGEKVWISGTLAEEGQRGGASTAYRAGPTQWVMRGTSLEPLEVASGGLGRQFVYWRGFYKWAVGLLAIGWLLVHGVLFGHYYVLLVTGKAATAQITKTRTYITTSKNSKTTHYVIHGVLPPKHGNLIVDDEVSYSLYDAAKRGELKQAPFIYSRVVPSIHSIGEHANQDGIKAFFAFAAMIVACVAFAVVRRNAMPWYEQRRVVERGSGRLDESAWNVQVAGQQGLFEPGAPPKPPPGPGITKT